MFNNKIQKKYSNLSKKEKIIADYILNHKSEVVHMTISQLSKTLNIADSTVSLFCKSMGYKGFQDFKISLASDIGQQKDEVTKTIDITDSDKDVLNTVFERSIEALKNTMSIQNNEDISKSVELILNAHNVQFFGSGGSNIVALDAYHKFSRSGIKTKIDQESHMQIMSASQMTEKDVAIIISHSGATKDMLDIINVLKDRHVNIIAITNHAISTITKKADVVLYTASHETSFSWEALSSRIVQLSIIDSLYTLVSLKNKEESMKALNNIRDSISYKRL